MSLVKLTVMLLSLPNRLMMLEKLVTELERQSVGVAVEILYFGDNRSFPIGQKRNMLMQHSQGEYTCWIDDDDFVSPTYINSILEGTDSDPDVICWTNKVTIQGAKMIPHPSVNLCHFSIKYNPEINDTKTKIYYHRPCHVNPIKRDISIKYDFDECSYCMSDLKWAERISKELKTEYIIPDIMYYHRYGFSNDKKNAPKTGRQS